jgi:NAD(P)-dependent dehydrogenase (short-subunit alcohol dehydrogenase family)
MTTAQRVAIVTGASSGIGRGIARALAADGLHVVNADVRREPKEGDHYGPDESVPTDRLIERDYGVRGTYVETDVSDAGQVETLVSSVVAEFDRLDVLVNNAGIIVPGTSQETTPEDWQAVVDVNLTGNFLTSKYAIPHLKRADHGRIVNVSSVNAKLGGAGPAYSATKAGILSLTRDLAFELAPSRVTVNAVLPGVIKTPLQDVNDEETRRRQAERTPLPRIGEPADVGTAVRFLASEPAEWITGTSLPVDGGYLLGGF